MSTGEDPGNVIHMVDVAATATVRQAPMKYRCSCVRVTVDEQTRMLECRDCGRKVDPFDYMHDWATRQDNRATSLKMLQHEIQRLSGEVKELERQKRNLQASVRRLNKKLG